VWSDYPHRATTHRARAPKSVAERLHGCPGAAEITASTLSPRLGRVLGMECSSLFHTVSVADLSVADCVGTSSGTLLLRKGHASLLPDPRFVQSGLTPFLRKRPRLFCRRILVSVQSGSHAAPAQRPRLFYVPRGHAFLVPFSPLPFDMIVYDAAG
jgi:hypothetical protein